ncbi:MAG: hypothetical protein KJ622_17260 [Alphaproteobacteria bacterium]|nr:hypothetical protein [Alphaproteobacteria bacterium]
MPDDLISISEIARTHSRHRSVVHKIIKRLGLETLRLRSDEVRGQVALHITRDCEKLNTDVFRTDAIQNVLDRADRFFENMPSLTD